MRKPYIRLKQFKIEHNIDVTDYPEDWQHPHRQYPKEARRDHFLFDHNGHHDQTRSD
jgi:hypothetical protein